MGEKKDMPKHISKVSKEKVEESKERFYKNVHVCSFGCVQVKVK